MPVDTQHPDYIASIPRWTVIRDCLGGREAILRSKKKYVPMLYEQEQAEYESYVGRGVWFGATESTRAAWSGIITRKPPELKAPSLVEFLDNCDGQGTPFTTFTQGVIEELVGIGRGGTLIDWTADNKAYITNYLAEEIINWKTTVIGGRRMLAFVMLYEASTQYLSQTGQPAPDVYDQTTYEQWREIRLTGDTLETLAVEVIVWRAKFQDTRATTTAVGDAGPSTAAAKSREFVEISRAPLTRRGKPVREIPFVFHTCANLDPVAVAKPPLLDIAHINVQHFAASTDLWNGRHIAGLPTPWAKCFTDDTTKVLTLGSSKAWTTDNENAECGFLEFQGGGLTSLKEGQAELEAMMAKLGARALTPEKADAEAYQTVELRARSESSTLVTVVEQASRSLSLVLAWAAWAQGTDGDRASYDKQAFVMLNKDITATTATPEVITAFVAALQGGAISYETFFYNMNSREVYPDGTKLEEEKTRIEQGAPAPPVPEPPPEPTA